MNKINIQVNVGYNRTTDENEIKGLNDNENPND